MKAKLTGIFIIAVLSLAMLITVVGAVQEAVSAPDSAPPPAGEVITVSLKPGENETGEDKPLWKYVCPFH